MHALASETSKQFVNVALAQKLNGWRHARVAFVVLGP